MLEHRQLKLILGAIVAILVATVPLVVVVIPLITSEEVVTINTVEPSVNVDAQIREKLDDIRLDLGAGGAWVAEYFLTVDGDVRGFNLRGSGAVTHIATKATVHSDLMNMLMIGQRHQITAPFTDPSNDIAKMNENLSNNRFWLVPDIQAVDHAFTRTNDWIGPSFYAIAGYDLRGRMVISVWIGLFSESTTLTEDDLRRSVNDVQEIVAILSD